MSYDSQKRSSSHHPVSGPDRSLGGPGKQTLVMQFKVGAEPIVQRKGDGGGSEGPATVPSGGGQALPADVAGKMAGAFGTDLSSVRVHEGAHVSALGAQAYTQGTDIHFAPGQYQPGSPQGQELIGHELAHVVQQSQGRVAATMQAKASTSTTTPPSSTRPMPGAPAPRAASRWGPRRASRSTPAAPCSAR